MPLFPPPPVLPPALYSGELSNNATLTLVATTCYLVSVTLPAPCTLTGVRVRFNAGGNGHYDVGIYDATGTNSGPNNLLAHAASTNTSLASATGAQTPAFLTGNLSLSQGNYWLAFWTDNATDTVNKQTNGNTSIDIVQSGTNAGPLPALASSISGLANASTKPILIGIISGGWT